MEVDGLESTTEVEEFADGDELTLHKRPGRTNYSNIIFKAWIHMTSTAGKALGLVVKASKMPVG